MRLVDMMKNNCVHLILKSCLAGYVDQHASFSSLSQHTKFCVPTFGNVRGIDVPINTHLCFVYLTWELLFSIIDQECPTLPKKHAQLPAVDMQKVQQSFCDCADSTVTVPKHLHMQTGGVWMAPWLDNCKQLGKFFFAVPVEYTRPKVKAMCTCCLCFWPGDISAICLDQLGCFGNMATFILPIEINRLPHHSCKTSHFLLVCRAKMKDVADQDHDEFPSLLPTFSKENLAASVSTLLDDMPSKLLNSKGTSSLPFRMEEVYESTQQEESETQRQMHMWWQWLGDKQLRSTKLVFSSSNSNHICPGSQIRYMWAQQEYWNMFLLEAQYSLKISQFQDSSKPVCTIFPKDLLSGHGNLSPRPLHFVDMSCCCKVILDLSASRDMATGHTQLVFCKFFAFTFYMVLKHPNQKRSTELATVSASNITRGPWPRINKRIPVWFVFDVEKLEEIWILIHKVRADTLKKKWQCINQNLENLYWCVKLKFICGTERVVEVIILMMKHVIGKKNGRLKTRDVEEKKKGEYTLASQIVTGKSQEKRKKARNKQKQRGTMTMAMVGSGPLRLKIFTGEFHVEIWVNFKLNNIHILSSNLEIHYSSTLKIPGMHGKKLYLFPINKSVKSLLKPFGQAYCLTGHKCFLIKFWLIQFLLLIQEFTLNLSILTCFEILTDSMIVQLNLSVILSLGNLHSDCASKLGGISLAERWEYTKSFIGARSFLKCNELLKHFPCFCCYSVHSPRVFQPIFDAQSLCRLQWLCQNIYICKHVYSGWQLGWRMLHYFIFLLKTKLNFGLNLINNRLTQKKCVKTKKSHHNVNGVFKHIFVHSHFDIFIFFHHPYCWSCSNQISTFLSSSVVYHGKKNLLSCLQLTCSMLQPSFHPSSTCLHM
ncbi:hypothetical protein VP01_2523g1 [Puccinia sorghi]|uniref:Uncharacterized protein n=1 Tax=Puccinia sorghi TaxID=27349 RepID=A0A0L6V644_9BASI|nr:hypothetical protein VP01_2523g1 [Puccinia sorghi]